MATDWKKLAEPFPADDIEWRVQTSGEKNGRPWARVLAYVTARAIQQRMDDVFGPGGWKNEYRAGADGGVICRIYFRNDEGEWVWREDGAENTDIEGVKGGMSGALKRAGAALGIGRYLYNLDEGYAQISDRGKHYTKPKTGAAFKWDPPQLPAWALPSERSAAPAAKKEAPAQKQDASVALTDDQAERIEDLLADSVFTDERRAAAHALLAKTPTYEFAERMIKKLLREINGAEAVA